MFRFVVQSVTVTCRHLALNSIHSHSALPCRSSDICLPLRVSPAALRALAANPLYTRSGLRPPRGRASALTSPSGEQGPTLGRGRAFGGMCPLQAVSHSVSFATDHPHHCGLHACIKTGRLLAQHCDLYGTQLDHQLCAGSIISR